MHFFFVIAVSMEGVLFSRETCDCSVSALCPCQCFAPNHINFVLFSPIDHVRSQDTYDF